MRNLEEKIDEILNESSKMAMLRVGSPHTYAVESLKSLFTATLKEVVAEVVGEDEKKPRVVEQLGYMKYEIRNNLRAEQRQRLQAIINSLEKV